MSDENPCGIRKTPEKTVYSDKFGGGRHVVPELSPWAIAMTPALQVSETGSDFAWKGMTVDKLSDHEASAIEEACRLSRGGDIAAAEGIFHSILKTNDRNNLIYWIFGYEYLNNNMNKESIECFRRAIELEERCMQAWGGLGRALIALERWDEAEVALRRRLELGESANHLVYLGTVLLRKSKYEDALSCCERALRLDDNQVDALINQGFAYSLLGLHEKAVESCRKAISIDREYDEAHICLGVVLSRANELEEASEALQRAIDINPQSASAYHEFGLLQYLKGDSVLAKAYLQSSVDLGRGRARDRDGNR